MANLVNASTPTLKVVIVGISLVGLVLGAVFLSSRISSVEEGSTMDATTNITIAPMQRVIITRCARNTHYSTDVVLLRPVMIIQMA